MVVMMVTWLVGLAHALIVNRDWLTFRAQHTGRAVM